MGFFDGFFQLEWDVLCASTTKTLGGHCRVGIAGSHYRDELGFSFWSSLLLEPLLKIEAGATEVLHIN